MVGGLRVSLRVGMGMSSTCVLDIGDVSTIGVIHVVSHSLETTIGEQNVVFALGGVPVTGLGVAEISAGVVIVDFVLVGVVNGDIVVRGMMGGVVKAGSVGLGLGHKGKKGQSDKSLKNSIFLKP